ncbi:MAG: phosphoribosyltransferase [Patescibacteria group bacterium]
MKKRHYTWEQFDADTKKIVKLIKKTGKKFDGVWGPPRGGLVSAVMLSHALNIPLLSKPTLNTLIVDDIADTGKTLKTYKGKNFIVTSFYHQQSAVVPDIWIREKKEQWIVFPWEKM